MRFFAVFRQTMNAEQITLEASLDPARKAMTSAAVATAWLEGWALPVETAISEALTPPQG